MILGVVNMKIFPVSQNLNFGNEIIVSPSRFKDEMRAAASLGMSLDDYLKSIGRTRDLLPCEYIVVPSSSKRRKSVENEKVVNPGAWRDGLAEFYANIGRNIKGKK